MHHRLAATLKTSRGVIFALTSVACLVSSGCFQSAQQADDKANAPAVTGVAAISSPFSFGIPSDCVVAAAVAQSPEALPLQQRSERFSPFNRQTYLSLEPMASVAQPLRVGAGFQRHKSPWSGPAAAELSDSLRLPIYSGPRTLSVAASLNLDSPFKSLFATVFSSGGEKAALFPGAPAGEVEEASNPFTQAKDEALAAAAAAMTKPAAPPTTTAPPNADEPPADSTKGTAAGTQGVAGGPGPITLTPEARFVFLGDFDGSGILQAAGANRVNGTTFAFSDAKGKFDLFINPAAVELQRSFAIDDINGDGHADLLVTSRASLFGGVLLGGSEGNFQLADTFVTGYEPTVAVAGLLREGIREILSVNVRTGSVTTFSAADRYRQVRDQALIDFLPDYVGRLVELQTGRDFFLAAQAGKPARIYGWREDSVLYSSGATVPGDPSIHLVKDFLQANTAGVLQVYQVGSAASVVLSNSSRQKWNVVNLRVMPRIFIAIGDLSDRGTLDVAVAYLRE